MAANDQENLLRYYNDELTYLRRMGAHFGRRYSKIAGRLEQSEDSALDPHVQRLVESFAFLTARIQRQMDAEFSRITTALLGVLYPHLVNPIPPMTIAKFDVDPHQRKMTTYHLIPKNTGLFAQTPDGLPCRFRTCYPVTLWPFEIESASFQSPDKLDFLNQHPQVATVLRLSLAPRGVSLAEMRPDLQRLRFFLRGNDVLVHALYELLFTRVWRVALLPQSKEPPVFLPDDSILPVGFGPDEAVIPYPPHSHPAYALLQEYFQFPQKFLFFDLANLDRHPSLNPHLYPDPEPNPDEKLDILILLTEIPRQRLVIDRQTFALGCTPVVNLFPKTSEPIRLDHTQLEYRLIPDIRRERTHEIHTILSVSASSNPMEESARIDPFFSFQHRRNGKETRAFWHARRTPTGREDLPGTEIYLSFLDLDLNPAQPPDQTVFAHTLCTNRDLTAQLQPRTRLQIENAAPLNDISCLYKPTEPAYPPIEGASLWALVSNLSLNYLSLSGGKESIEALREILRLYSFSDAPATHNQVQGIRQMSARRVVRRILHDDWRGFCQGAEVTLEFDEDQYVGSGAFLLGAVLERFFALYASINSFTELVITRASQPGREWKHWPPRAGYQPIL
jgi:type VI secretion system protein ImpG